LQVTDRQVMSALIKTFDSFGPRRGGVDRITFFAQMLPQRVGNHLLVIDNQNSHILVLHLFSSNETAARLMTPSPYDSRANYVRGSRTRSRLVSYSATPPCASIIFAANDIRMPSLPRND